VLVDAPSNRAFTLSVDGGNARGTLHADRILYATMKFTDVLLYRLVETNSQIAAAFHVMPMTLADHSPKPGQDVIIVSGFWRHTYACRSEAIVSELHEGEWSWRDVLRYSGCDTPPGSSGSPVLDTQTGEVIAVAGTANAGSAKSCTRDNPCEIEARGTASKSRAGYAHQVANLEGCLSSENRIDVTRTGCDLPAR
jgi:hypothetical protein